MQASLVIATNIFKRDAYQVTPIKRRRRISTLAPKIDKPFICLYNGEAILRKDWLKTVLNDGDIVAFVVCPPQGNGGGSNPLATILSIGLAIALPGIGGALATALHVTSATGIAIVTGIAGMAGRAVIGSIFGTPSAPSSQINSALSSPSPTYTLSAQGNVSRIGEVIPVIYGRNKIFPSFAASPYTEFNGNEQFLYQLLCVGQGYFDIEQINVLDTPISSFPEVTYEVIEPGGTVTLFPANVISSQEVSSQELVSNAVGPFVATPNGTTCNAIAVDVVLPKGLYYANNAGGLDQRSVTFNIEAQLINNSGAAIGAWFVLGGTQTIQERTTTAIRRSYRFDVQNGRYQVRVTRTSPKSTDSRTGNDLFWTGLRAYVPGNQQYGNVTLVAMRMQATNSLSSQSSRGINMIVTRKLPKWNGSSWSAPVATRSIAWALANMCRNTDYGAGYPDHRIDLAQLLDLDHKWTLREDTFNGVFDSPSTFWEALTLCAKAGRAKPYRQGGIIHFVRDEPRNLPVAMFNMQNITEGNVKVQYLMPTDETADVIEMKFWNEDLWNWDYIECKLPDSTASKSAKITIFGVTNRNQVWREGMYLAAHNRYRRTLVSLGSEMEGFIPSFGDLCALTHDRPLWGQSGEVVSYNPSTKLLTLSAPLDWTEVGTKYIAFRYRNGALTQSYVVTPGATEYQAQLAVTLPFTPDVGNDRERTYYVFGVVNYKRALLAGVKPRDLQHCDLSFVLEDDRVHSADNTSPPPSNPSLPLPVVISKPVMTSINIVQDGSPESPVLILDWPPSKDADHYIVDLSTDGNFYARVKDITSNIVRIDVPVGDVWLRVAAVGLLQGDFVFSGKITTGKIPPPQSPILQLAEAFVGQRLKIKWDKVLRAISTRIEVRGAGNLVRTLTTTFNTFEYTAEDAIHDGGPWRELIITGYSVGATEDSGGNSITVSNPQIGAINMVRVFSGYRAGFVSYAKPADTDFKAVKVHLSTVNGFTPNASNLVYQGDSNMITLTKTADEQDLNGGTLYYIKLGGYDTFGADNINYGVNQYQFTALSVGVPTSQELLDQLNAAIQDPAVANSLVLTADRFALRLSDNGVPTDVYPFVLGQVAGQTVLGISADVVFNGKLSASNIISGTLDATESIIVGDGSMVLSGSGALTVYQGASSVSNRDFATLNAGDINFFRYRNGAYFNYNSIKRIEQGLATSGQTVTIPGYFDVKPFVQVSPNAIMSFNYDYRNQSQAWAVRADNLRESPIGSGIWKFDAVAELNLSTSSGSLTVNDSVVQAGNTYNTAVQNLPANTATLKVNVALRSQRGTGSNTNVWFRRQVTWTVYYKSGVANFTALQTKTTQIGDTLNAVNDFINLAGLSGSGQQIYISFTAADKDGSTFSLGADIYSYASATVPDNGAVGYAVTSSSVNSGTIKTGSEFRATNSPTKLTMSDYSPPQGWEVYQVQYTYQWAFYTLSGGYYGIINGIQYGPYAQAARSSLGVQGIQFGPFSFTSGDFLTRTDVVAGNYNKDYHTIVSAGTGTGLPKINLRNASAVLSLRSITKNSNVASNTFNFVNFDWAVSGAVALSLGSLNWLAVGE